MSTKNNPKVSVIVPVYNVEKYIEKCLETLVNQTLEDIEIIVVNDGSPDNSQEIIDKYAKKYPKKVKAFIKENGGLSDARNYGIKKATGEYLAFVDSDDFVEIDMFESMYNKAIETSSEIVVIPITYEYFDKTTCSMIDEEEFNRSIVEKPDILLLSKSFAWNKIYKKDLWLKYNFEFPKNKWFEDSYLIYNVMLMANKISAINYPFYHYYRAREDAITKTVNKKVFDIFDSCENIISFYKENTNYSEIEPTVMELCVMHIYARINLIRYCKDIKLKNKFIDKMFDFLNHNFKDWRVSEIKKQANMKKRLTFKYIYNRFRNTKLLLKAMLFSYPYLLSLKKRDTKYPNLTSEQFKELKQLELDILLKFDKYCKDNKLTYFLGEGSLLGGIRHNGFIPWDDDIDVLMPRSDYNKLVDLVSDKPVDGCALINYRTFKKYHLPFTKLVTLEKTGFINYLDKNLGDFSGPFIDIFPIDKVNDDPKQYKEWQKMRNYRDLLLYKVNYVKANSLKRKFKKFVSKFYSFSYLHNKINALATKYENEDTKYRANIFSSYTLDKQLVNKKNYSKAVSIDFEGKKINVPVGYKKILSTIYGDFMQMPPQNKRYPKHGFYFDETKKN